MDIDKRIEEYKQYYGLLYDYKYENPQIMDQGIYERMIEDFEEQKDSINYEIRLMSKINK